ncbi:MAG: hypothetical protein V9H26_22465 [Verrucomicrobiota bacterium]
MKNEPLVGSTAQAPATRCRPDWIPPAHPGTGGHGMIEQVAALEKLTAHLVQWSIPGEDVVHEQPRARHVRQAHAGAAQRGFEVFKGLQRLLFAGRGNFRRSHVTEHTVPRVTVVEDPSNHAIIDGERLNPGPDDRQHMHASQGFGVARCPFHERNGPGLIAKQSSQGGRKFRLGRDGAKYFMPDYAGVVRFEQCRQPLQHPDRGFTR